MLFVVCFKINCITLLQHLDLFHGLLENVVLKARSTGIMHQTQNYNTMQSDSKQNSIFKVQPIKIQQTIFKDAA